MKTIKSEILQIITAFNLGTFQGLRTIDNDFIGMYTETKFWTEQGIFKHYKLNK